MQNGSRTDRRLRGASGRAGRGGDGHRRLPAAAPDVRVAARRRRQERADHRLRFGARLAVGAPLRPLGSQGVRRLRQHHRRRSRAPAGRSQQPARADRHRHDVHLVGGRCHEDDPQSDPNARKRYAADTSRCAYVFPFDVLLKHDGQNHFQNVQVVIGRSSVHLAAFNITLFNKQCSLL